MERVHLGQIRWVSSRPKDDTCTAPAVSHTGGELRILMQAVFIRKNFHATKIDLLVSCASWNIGT